jgi:hypothetical protein
MSCLKRNRVLACAGVRLCRSQEDGADNNRRGQDKSGSPAGAYAVVVPRFSMLLASRLGAASGLKPLRTLAFSGTNAGSPFP